MHRLCLAAALGLLACGKRTDEPRDEPAPPPAGSASASPGRLVPIAQLRERARLVEGSGRIAVWVGDRGWYEPDVRGLADRPAIGGALGDARAALGDEAELGEVFLGAHPILVGGAEHRERCTRFAPAPAEVALHGMLVQVVTTPRVELWRIEHELRSVLATIGADHRLAELPALALAGPADPGRSPVSAKACAAPKVRDLAAVPGEDAIVALITECHPAAPVRLATYRWTAGAAAPAVTVQALGTLAELGLQLDRLVIRAGAPLLVGRRGDTAVVVPAGGGAPRVEIPGIESISHAAVAPDGAVWLRAVGRGPSGRDRIVIARDGVPVAVTGRPDSLATDERLGIVVLTLDGATPWIFAEHRPAR